MQKLNKFAVHFKQNHAINQSAVQHRPTQQTINWAVECHNIRQQQVYIFYILIPWSAHLWTDSSVPDRPHCIGIIPVCDVTTSVHSQKNATSCCRQDTVSIAWYLRACSGSYPSSVGIISLMVTRVLCLPMCVTLSMPVMHLSNCLCPLLHATDQHLHKVR
jgi:hypothetical protein